MFWIILLSVVILIIGWMLIAPIRVIVYYKDADHQLQLQWMGIFRIQLFTATEQWLLQIRFFFFTKDWPLMQLLTPTKKKAGHPKKKSRSWRPKRPFTMLGRLGRSFRIIRFRLHMDTDDFISNAYLFPVFQLVSQRGKLDWQINFSGRNELQLIIENRLYKLLYALFRDQIFFHQKN